MRQHIYVMRVEGAVSYSVSYFLQYTNGPTVLNVKIVLTFKTLNFIPKLFFAHFTILTINSVYFLEQHLPMCNENGAFFLRYEFSF